MSSAVASRKTSRLPRSKRRAQLLGAARQVFVSQGYHAAAMDDIADVAGVSKPVLYQHFPSKLELYLALVEAGARQLVATVRQSLDNTRDNSMRVQAAVAGYFDFIDDSAEFFRLLFEGDLVNDDEVLARVQNADDQCADLLAGVICEDTGLSYPEGRLLAFGLMGMAHTAARRWLREPDDALSRQKAAELIASLGWRGISGFPASATRAAGRPAAE